MDSHNFTQRINRLRREPAEDNLSQLYGLTPAEVRLAKAFLAEASIRDAATSEGLTNGTARQYLKRIFKKTGTHNQAQLMRLLLSVAEKEQDGH